MRPVDRRTEAYRRFMTVMNKRNFNIHGNVDPEREALETVYFERQSGRCSLRLATTSGASSPTSSNSTSLMSWSRTTRPCIRSCMSSSPTWSPGRFQQFLATVIDDPFPGFEVRERRVTRILPDHVPRPVLLSPSSGS